jgi:hypothetical protein
MPYQPTAPRRRLWPVFVPFALVAALAVLWVGLWYYAAGAAERAFAGWHAREAKAGRIHDCGTRTVGGFPFRIEIRCTEPSVELRGASAPVRVKAANVVAAVQIYQPTHLIAEFAGPMTIAESAARYTANWTLGQASVRGTPQNPERGSLAVDGPVLTRAGDNAPLFKAKRFEAHARVVEGSLKDNPVIELVVRTNGAIAPDLHALVAEPIDSDINALLHGVRDLSPKPWTVRLREIQARGGRIEIVKARIQRGETIAVTSGTLALTDRGMLDGQLQMTVVGLEHALKSIDLESELSQGRVGSNIDRLDRLVPGLGAIARKNAAPGILAGVGALGKRTVLEGKAATTLPLRFVDGRVMLGPIPVGRTSPLW